MGPSHLPTSADGTMFADGMEHIAYNMRKSPFVYNACCLIDHGAGLFRVALAKGASVIIES